MKSTLKQTLFLALGALAAWAACARADEKPVPRPPYVAPVPAWGHWTVTFKYPPAPAATDGTKPAEVPHGLPGTLDTVKTGEVRAVTATDTAGTAQVFFQQGNWVVTSTPGGPQLLSVSPTMPPYPNYSSGFPLLDKLTISPATFRETAKYNGVPCFHYQDKEYDAWIAVDTMLPVAVKTPDGAEAGYEFLPVPTAPVILPPAQAALLQRSQAAYQYSRTLH